MHEVALVDGEVVGDKVVLDSRVDLDDVTPLTPHVQVNDTGRLSARRALLHKEHVSTILEEMNTIWGLF